MKYTYEQIEKLSRKISNIRNKACIVDIVGIIKKHNPSIKFVGMKAKTSIIFDKLSDETYVEIEQYLLDNKIMKNISSIETEVLPIKKETSEVYDPSEFEEREEVPYENKSKLKYSNREKTLIRKQSYAKAITEQTHAFSETSTKSAKSTSSTTTPTPKQEQPAKRHQTSNKSTKTTGKTSHQKK